MTQLKLTKLNIKFLILAAAIVFCAPATWAQDSNVCAGGTVWNPNLRQCVLPNDVVVKSNAQTDDIHANTNVNGNGTTYVADATSSTLGSGMPTNETVSTGQALNTGTGYIGTTATGPTIFPQTGSTASSANSSSGGSTNASGTTSGPATAM